MFSENTTNSKREGVLGKKIVFFIDNMDIYKKETLQFGVQISIGNETRVVKT